jgi:hypothetical protein
MNRPKYTERRTSALSGMDDAYGLTSSVELASSALSGVDDAYGLTSSVELAFGVLVNGC